MVRIAAIILAAGLLTPAAPPPVPAPPPLPVLVMPNWQALPDLAGYVAFQVPVPAWLAIGECRAETPCEWYDVACQTVRLIEVVKQLFLDLFCFLLSMFQFVANVAALVANGLIAVLNAIYRLGLYAVLIARFVYELFWYAFEWVRLALWTVIGYLFLVALYLQFILDSIILAINLLGVMLLLIAQIVILAIGLVAWTVSLTISGLLAGIASLTRTTTPAQVAGGHPIYYYVRGLGEGARDSAVGWMFVLIWGMCYVAAIWWIGHFVSSRGAGGE